MIPKAELRARNNELEEHLQLIYKYKPSLRCIEENVSVLESLGLDERDITEVISKGSTYVTNTICNPLTGEEMAIFVEEVSVKMDEAGMYDVYIGAIPYREFFTERMLTKDKLDSLSKDNPEVKVIYDENQKLKGLLNQLGKKA